MEAAVLGCDDTATLEIVVRAADGRLPQGNLFPVLTHLGTGRSWRNVTYAHRFRGFSFTGLPPGDYRLVLISAGHAEVRLDLTLAAGRNRHEARLEARTEDLLILPIEAAAPTPSSDHLATRLLRGLLADPVVMASLEGDLEALPGQVAAEARHAGRLARLGFPADARPAARRLFWSIVDRRCRLEEIVMAIFRSPAVAYYLDVDPARIAAAAAAAIDNLDRLDVMDMLILLAWRSDPWVAVMNEVVRAQAGPRDVLIPPGLAAEMRSAPAASPPRRGCRPGRWTGGLADQTVTKAGLFLGDVSLLIAEAHLSEGARWATTFAPAAELRAVS